MNWRFESVAAKLPAEAFPIRRDHADRLRAGGYGDELAEREAIIEQASEDFGRLAREWQARIVAADDQLTMALRDLEAEQLDRARGTA